ncbi:MAG: HAD family phosphatase [Blautia sp.]|nr:HAD family phosphatase [Blautia sp.]
MKQYKAVIFDMDGVIFDSENKVVECWQIVAEKYGIPDIEAACHDCLGLTREATEEVMMKRYGASFPYQTYKKECSALFHERYGEGRLPLKPGVVELLSWLRENRIRTALASSTRSEIVRQELSDAGIIDFFDKIICGDMVSRSKPAPDIFLKACEELGVKPEEAYAVEDSYNGIRSASAGGLMPLMVPDLAEPTEEMKKLAVAVLPSLMAVKAYLAEEA